MPPKKDAGGAKKKKDAEPPPAPSEFDALDTASLKRILLELRTDTEKVSRERAQAQVDRDAVERFFEVTKKELRETELSILAKEREMDLLAESHRQEASVYQQKVKHLEYEHRHGMKKLGAEEEMMLKADEDSHLRREANMRAEKSTLKSRVREAEEANAEAVRSMKSLQEKNLSKLRQEFSANLESLRTKYEARLLHLREDLLLRRKVETHECEERKNLHLNQLLRAHDESFAEMKRYYNDITKANLQLIAQLRATIAEQNEKVSANQRLMREIAEQNTRLKDPLERATKDLKELHEELKDAEKDKQSLRYAKGRLASLRTQLATLEKDHADLEGRYAEAEKERQELYQRFEAMVSAARTRAEAKNEVLERRLLEVENEYLVKKSQVSEVMVAAKLDPSLMTAVNARLDAILETRNTLLRELQHAVATLAKAHNDSARVLAARLRDMGVPAEEVAYPLLPSATGLAPAGLVSKPSV